MTFLWPGLLLLLAARAAAGRRLRLEPPPPAADAASAIRACRSSMRRSPAPDGCDGTCRSRCSRWRWPPCASRIGRPIAIASVPTNQTTIVLVIDVSGSMCSDDIAPTRLQAAESAAASFIEHQGPSTQIGIVAFSGFAQVVQSPTNDKVALPGRPAQPDDRTPDGDRQRDPGRHRRDRRGRPVGPGQHRRRPPGGRAAARRDRRVRAGHHRRPDRRREQLRARSARRGEAGGHTRHPRLHDRVRDGGRRPARPELRDGSSGAASPATGSAVAGSAAAVEAAGSGAASTTRRSSRSPT